MKAEAAHVGARGVDCITLLDAEKAGGLEACGIDFVCQYLGAVTPEGVAAILRAGLDFFPVTYAKHFDGPAAVAQCRALGLPQGVTIWLDLEGVLAPRMPASGDEETARRVIDLINAWARMVKAGGYDPGLYVGANALLTSHELYALPEIDRYWKGLSRIQDRNGQIAEPTCGWCMTQLYPTQKVAGVEVDFDFVQQDFRGRVPTWATA